MACRREVRNHGPFVYPDTRMDTTTLRARSITLAEARRAYTSFDASVRAECVYCHAAFNPTGEGREVAGGLLCDACLAHPRFDHDDCPDCGAHWSELMSPCPGCGLTVEAVAERFAEKTS